MTGRDDLLDLVWPAPGKVNLFLHITGRRPDGYHLLQTAFQFLSYGDELRFTLRDDGIIERVTPTTGVAHDDDLTVRAARALKPQVGPSQGVSIHLDKKLPMGGGLGGGSSDAATTLVALNILWEIGLSIEELAQVGLLLGADVPVFVHGRAAWAEGVGEKLCPLELNEPWFLVVVPDCQVSTAVIFSDPELTRDQSPITIRSFLEGNGGNVCEPVTRRRHPPVDLAFRWLEQFGQPRMSGTGACVFVAFPTQAAAEAVYNSLPKGWQGFVAEGKNESALRRVAREAEALIPILRKV